MSPLATIFLFLHVMGAIAAFGPSFVLPIIASQSRKMPSGALFGLKLTDAVERRLIIPLGIFQGITGVGLIWTIGFNLTATHWLAAGIVLYLIAIVFAIVIQARTVESMIHLVESAPAPAPGTPPGPPPPAFLALAKRAQNGGIFLTVLLVLIVFFMAVKPQF
ncbi:MAG: DUF2269 family protein [Candidatus Limnocylindrales bacterium]